MTLAEPKQAPLSAERVCQCPAPLLQTRASGKWAHERYCDRCGLLAPISFRR
jgi:hypothetical protein